VLTIYYNTLLKQKKASEDLFFDYANARNWVLTPIICLSSSSGSNLLS
jgi:hypothetical protein